jgi:competence protein ComGC
MNALKEKSCAAKIITLLATSLIVGFIIVIVIPNFIRARYETATNACINNLRQIESAKEQWKIENSKNDGDVVTEGDIKPYLNGNLPKCPAGGTYTINPIGENPKCSIGISTWPNDHILNETNSRWKNFKAAYGKVFGLNQAQTLLK